MRPVAHGGGHGGGLSAKAKKPSAMINTTIAHQKPEVKHKIGGSMKKYRITFRDGTHTIVECRMVNITENGDLILYGGPSNTILIGAYTAGYWLSCVREYPVLEQL